MGLIICLCWISSSKHDIELEFGLEIELELGLTNESSQAKPSQSELKLLYFIMSSNLNIIVGLYQAQTKLEHSTFAVDPSLTIHYSTKLGSFTALRGCKKWCRKSGGGIYRNRSI